MLGHSLQKPLVGVSASSFTDVASRESWELAVGSVVLMGHVQQITGLGHDCLSDCALQLGGSSAGSPCR